MLNDIWVFVAVGMISQLIDGALGMAYGVSCTSFLLSLGLAPASATASVKISEVFTTLVSGLSHLKLGNVDWTLLKRLLIPGAAGGFLGAYVLTAVNGEVIKPYITVYLLIMGVVILWKAFRRIETRGTDRLIPLGLVGGFCDAIGGGGWGPIVTTTLVANGHHARTAVGSVNTAEFCVTFVQAVTFVSILGLQQNWQPIVGLLVGGTLAAPLAARFCRLLPRHTLMVLVGTVIVLISLRNLLASLKIMSINWVYFAIPLALGIITLAVRSAMLKPATAPNPGTSLIRAASETAAHPPIAARGVALRRETELLSARVSPERE